MRSASASGRQVVHIASHSFTPELNGEVRTADIGWLYDPGRFSEALCSTRWLEAVRRLQPELRLRRNYPYIGKSDGLTFCLRRAYPAEVYLGIELEVNQQFVRRGGRPWRKLRATLIDALASALSASPFERATQRAA